MTIEELQELRKELTRHDYRYYILAMPIISDYEYDMMYKKWQNIIGQDTHSCELKSAYPDWVIEELDNEHS